MRLDPPPTVVKDFGFQWKTWINNLVNWLKSPYGNAAKRISQVDRDALVAENGLFIYNTTTNQFNFYENGAWVIK